jgi:hypothetical protein
MQTEVDLKYQLSLAEINLLRVMVPRDQTDAVLWNRNRNFLPCGTGTVTCQKVGTVTYYGSGTLIKWYHKSSHKHAV